MKSITRALSIAFLGIAMALGLAACSKQEPPPSRVSIDESREQGRQNAAYNATLYQATNPRIQGWDLLPKADSLHSSACPQGDGWAEVVFMSVERIEGSKKNASVEKATVMCSTTSAAEGCVMVAPVDNWSKHPKFSMDGRCGNEADVPFPLPKLGTVNAAKK